MEDEKEQVFFSRMVPNVKIEFNDDEFFFTVLIPNIEDINIEYVEFILPTEIAERMAH